jgi:hypothetical protein
VPFGKGGKSRSGGGLGQAIKMPAAANQTPRFRAFHATQFSRLTDPRAGLRLGAWCVRGSQTQRCRPNACRLCLRRRACWSGVEEAFRITLGRAIALSYHSDRRRSIGQARVREQKDATSPLLIAAMTRQLRLVQQAGQSPPV